MSLMAVCMAQFNSSFVQHLDDDDPTIKSGIGESYILEQINLIIVKTLNQCHIEQ